MYVYRFILDYLTTLFQLRILYHRMTIYYEFESLWKETVLACVKIYSSIWVQILRKIMKNLTSNNQSRAQNYSPSFVNYEAEVITTQNARDDIYLKSHNFYMNSETVSTCYLPGRCKY